MRIIVSVILASLLLPAQAADKSGNYAIWGKGAKSCYRYLKDRSGSGDASYREYIMGYLTAYNALAPETYSISRDMNLDEIMAWMDDYCTTQQMSGMEQALLEFIGSHHESRYRRPPAGPGR